MGERNFQNNLKKLWKTFPLTPIIISISLMNLSPPDQKRKYHHLIVINSMYTKHRYLLQKSCNKSFSFQLKWSFSLQKSAHHISILWLHFPTLPSRKLTNWTRNYPLAGEYTCLPTTTNRQIIAGALLNIVTLWRSPSEYLHCKLQRDLQGNQ